MARLTLVKKPRARARRGRQRYPLDGVMVERQEVQSWLRPFLEKVGGALRALHCPQCGGAAQRLYFVPARGPMFQCWTCAGFPRKRSMGELQREGEKTQTALAALVAAHQEKLSPDATPPPKPRVTYTLPHTPRPQVSASNKAKPRRGPRAKARHALEHGARPPLAAGAPEVPPARRWGDLSAADQAAFVARVQELQRQAESAQQPPGKFSPK